MMDRQDAIGMLFLNAKDQIERMKSINLNEIGLTEAELKDHEIYLSNYIEAVNIIGLEVEEKWHRIARMIDPRSKVTNDERR